MPLVDVGPMQLVAAGLELVPLNPSMQHVEDVVEDLVERELGSGSLHGSAQVRSDVMVEVFAGNLFRDRVIA